MRREVVPEIELDPYRYADHFGVMLERSRRAPAVSAAFTGIAYLRKLAGHRIRVKRAMKLIATEGGEKHLRKRRGKKAYRDKPRRFRTLKESAVMLGEITYGDLRLVNCARCRAVLLGESHEWIRTELETTPRARRRAAKLPPSVALRRNGVPLCLECTPQTEATQC